MLLVLVAAILLEAVSLIQYFYARNGLREEADARVQSEMQAAQLKMDHIFSTIEDNVQGIAYILPQRLDHPENIPDIIRLLMENKPIIANGFIAFTPDYLSGKGRWYEPVVTRTPEGLVLHEVGSADHDYFQAEWYRHGRENDSCLWSEPYYDNAGAKAMLVSCTYPGANARTNARNNNRT